MNKKGHVALGVAIGSAVLISPYLNLYVTSVSSWQTVCSSVLYLTAVAATSLAPDLDHKTSTASNLLQLSSSKRKSARMLGGLLLLTGLLLLLLPQVGYALPEGAAASAPLWIGTGILAFSLTRLRSLLLLAAGAGLLTAYLLYDWPWIAAFAGAALCLMPVIQHRGLIHTPEFAIALSAGLWTFAQGEAWWVQAICAGVVIGWWAHLVGDVFGREGIHSFLVPKVKVALRLFDNGGLVERTIARSCWIASFMMWLLFIGRLVPALGRLW
ncbi:hypothetical protein PghCCS26_46420 [Paenibacillus glycanilyticus]|uniref:Metal-dependent hydrolase n=1 Tax=Paenibacillus glycanilyticus TaxID=126569 RepID=A0ABQ6NTH6_9BACL|nr:metal-dependent hydrolase [Paenibacillus glycanilyticus]GMK47512.1 hypothetical protein PghCCS26_46420 [Paenibacillus glycanilyticus]